MDDLDQKIIQLKDQIQQELKHRQDLLQQLHTIQEQRKQVKQDSDAAAILRIQTAIY